MKFLLDTDTCIAAMRGVEKAAARVAAIPPDDCAVSTVTVYELAVGVAKCADPSREFDRAMRFLKEVHVLPFEADAARQAGGLRAMLKKKGKSIGPYDILIAAQAQLLGIPLLTGNVEEFSRVPGLRLVTW